MDEKGVRGIEMVLEPVTGESQSSSPHLVKTDSEGNFRFSNIPDGSYRLRVHSSQRFVVNIAKNSIEYWGKTILLQNGEAITGQNFTLKSGGVITGRVTDTKGKPLIEVGLALVEIDEKGQAQTHAQLNSPQYLQTDDRGIYRIFGIPAGKYFVKVHHQVRGVARPDVFYPGTTDQTKAQPIEVTANAEITDVDIQVDTNAKTFSINGKVLDERENTVPKFGVDAVGYEEVITPQGIQLNQLSGNKVETNSKGEFTFDNLMAGRYLVFAHAAHDRTEYSEPVKVELRAENYNGVEIRLVNGAKMIGKVQIEGEQNSSVLERIELRATNFNPTQPGSNQSRRTKINSDGSFMLEGLRPGKINFSLDYLSGKSEVILLRVEKNGRVINDYLEILSNEHLTGITIIVTTGVGKLNGQLNFAGGEKPIGHCFMIFAQRMGAPVGNTGFWGNIANADERGRFLFDKLPPGEYELVADPEYTMPCGATTKIPFFPTVRQRVTITNGSESNVTMTIKLGNNN